MNALLGQLSQVLAGIAGRWRRCCAASVAQVAHGEDIRNLAEALAGGEGGDFFDITAKHGVC
jgi:hypothetical protein